MPELDIANIKVGDHLKFKTTNQKDLVHWEGRVVAICGYEDASTQMDCLPYYWETKKSNPDLPEISSLTFIKLRVFENGNVTKRTFRFFALEYIDVSTLRVNDIHSDIVIKVYSVPNTEHSTIVNLLKTHGYVAKVQS